MMFDKVDKRLGFGCMRLKRDLKGEVDQQLFNKLVDRFIKRGYSYFDTAHLYLDGKSEIAVREGLVKRYKRDSYTLADKLTAPCWEKREDIRHFFFSQLEILNVEYIDFYLVHALNKSYYQKCCKEKAFDELIKLKEEGYIKHIAISFHDSPELLDQILSEHKEIEAVQIQFNYLDVDNVYVRSKECFDVCVKYDKPVIVMEPIKGGSLINLPTRAKKLLEEEGISPARLALDYILDKKQVFMILSGMNDEEMLDENIDIVDSFTDNTKEEEELVLKVKEMIDEEGKIGCTSCRYCMDVCPLKIEIPEIFSMYNEMKTYKVNKKAYTSDVKKKEILDKVKGCLKCGMCEKTCPQHLSIRDLLVDITKLFEEK